MNQRLYQLAEQLLKAIGTDTPRTAMQDVAAQLQVLARDRAVKDGESRVMAHELLHRINNSQYGLRGFGDGSLTRGRDLTNAELKTIKLALEEYSTKLGMELPTARYYHIPNGGTLYVTEPTTGVPAGAIGLYPVDQVQALVGQP